LVSVIVALSLGLSLVGADAPSRLISSISELKTLSPEEAAAEPPAQLEGTLTFVHRATFGVFGFVQSGADAVYFQVDDPQARVPEAGRRVRIDGRAVPGEFAPSLLGHRVEDLGVDAMPTPATDDVQWMATGRFDARWVEVEGVVRRHSYDALVQLHVLVLGVAGDEVTVELPGTVDGAVVEGWLGARVRVEGACGARFNGLRQLIGVRVLVPGPDHVRVVESAPATPLPVRPIGSLLRFDPTVRKDGWTRVRGTVSFIDGPRWIVQDTSGGALVRAPGQPAPNLGDTIEVVGYVGREGLTPLLNDARVLARRAGPLPEPMPAEDLTDPELTARRVQVECLVESLVLVEDEAQLVVLKNGQHIPVVVPARGLAPGVRRGAVLRLTAVVLPVPDPFVSRRIETRYAETASAVRLLVAGLDGDVQVLVAAPFWTGTRLGLLASGLVATVLLFASWTFALRRQVARNTSTIRHQLDEQKVLREEAQAANQAKSRFLATMSHELRTPLHGISSTVSMLQGSERLSKEDQELVGLIEASSRQLLRIVGDVLDLARAESHRLEPVWERVHVTELVRGVVEQVRPLAEESDLALELSLAEDLPEWVETDPVRLAQILQNLLTNAVKFTDQGSVSVAVRRAAEDRLQVEVRDTGPGITEEDQLRLFQPFSQLDGSIRRRHGGSGLGLAICRQLCELLGGEIQLDSRLGEGSTFSFTVRAPERPPPPAVEPGTRASSLPPMAVLVVDDNAVNRRIAKVMLERLGVDVTLAKDGREALDQVTASQFDLVLMDLHMPEMDGWEATRAIRSGLPDGGPPIVALTADALPETRDACAESGMQACLTKPFTIDALRELLQKDEAFSANSA
jgi:signal transduction histidine kinase/ActR/RegA family two-component response regulator